MFTSRAVFRVSLLITLAGGAGATLRAQSFDEPGLLERLNTPAVARVPTVKHLDEAWVRRLPARGTPTVLTRANSADFAFVGMPVGGIGAGQLYFGGDGRLWWWDIFNSRTPQKDFPAEQGAAYEFPPRRDGVTPDPHGPVIAVEQGFDLEIEGSGKTLRRSLDAAGFQDIAFRGQYPIATVTYRDSTLPATVELVAFSPFIPGDLAASSLPATMLRYTVRNATDVALTVTLSGRLENAVGREGSEHPAGRSNRIVAARDLTFLECAAEPAPADARAWGTMGLGLLGSVPAEVAEESLPAPAKPSSPVGRLGRRLILAPHESATVDFVLTWHFPDLELPKLGRVGRAYATRFKDARAVAEHVAGDFARLTTETEQWRDTWYDSTLPHWFLDRTFANVSTLATATTYLFGDGRLYAYEGVYSCPGTCTHVYHYAQATGRLFPAAMRDGHRRVNLGLALHAATGVIAHRAEFNPKLAVDGQAGVLLQLYREHLMSPDNAFLHAHWPQIKRAFDPLFALDPDADGILEGQQFNTLDEPWQGKIAWLSSLYVAAVRAGEEMALVAKDTAFAARCRTIARAGARSIPAQLFEGEYFVNRLDPKFATWVNSGTGCHIDQVLGQGWAFQVGLGRILPERETHSALRALWRNNFTTDVGPYRQANAPGRWYAMPGEGGVVMCTFPRDDWDFTRASGSGGRKNYAFYLNECMTGFEHQLAAHLLWEGLAPEALAIERTIHERYDASRRNPWNEVECGSHYGRAMASYGVFLAACGYEYDGPRGRLAFAPRLTPENFQAAFTAAEGWGSYRQQITGPNLTAEIALRWGSLRLATIALRPPSGATPTKTTAKLNGRRVSLASAPTESGLCTVQLATPVTLSPGDILSIALQP